MEDGDSLYACITKLHIEKEFYKDLHEGFAYRLFLEGKEFKARIAELEKENENLKKKNDELKDLVHNLGGRKCEICKKGNWELGLTELEMDYDDTTGFHCCQGQECLRQFWRGCDKDTDNEDEEKEEEVLENLSRDQLRDRLRTMNKPVWGCKAKLIKRIREHERLTAALFEED